MIARLNDAEIQTQLEVAKTFLTSARQKENQEECYLSLACNQALTNLISS